MHNRTQLGHISILTLTFQSRTQGKNMWLVSPCDSYAIKNTVQSESGEIICICVAGAYHSTNEDFSVKLTEGRRDQILKLSIFIKLTGFLCSHLHNIVSHWRNMTDYIIHFLFIWVKQRGQVEGEGRSEEAAHQLFSILASKANPAMVPHARSTFSCFTVYHYLIWVIICGPSLNTQTLAHSDK